MAQVSRTAIICGALLAALWAPSELLAQSNLKERVGSAIEAVEGACAADIGKFCGNVTRGEGRVLLLAPSLRGQCDIADHSDAFGQQRKVEPH